LCLNKAVKSGIRTARLPIGRYLASLPTRKVLTVNQVFDILVKWVETKDWEQALYSVIPKRKFQQGEKEPNVQIVDAATVEDLEVSP
jgi:tRNA (guanine9-N1)-methyltransferase